jgi:hypothetical protein
MYMNASFFIYPLSMALGGVGLKSLYILTCLILLMGAASAGEFGPNLRGDTYIDANNEDKPYGIEETLWATSDDGDPVKITFFNFQSLGEGRTADEIESGTFEVYVTDVEEEGNVSVHFCEGSILEDTLTWAHEMSYDEEAADTEYIGEDGWYTWDVTAIIKTAAEECQSCPWSIVMVAEDDASIEFASKENPEDLKAVLKYSTFE